MPPVRVVAANPLCQSPSFLPQVSGFRRPPVQITGLKTAICNHTAVGCEVPAVDEPWADVAAELDLEDRELLAPLLARLRPRDARRLH